MTACCSGVCACREEIRKTVTVAPARNKPKRDGRKIFMDPDFKLRD
jgi:hypothetical protein